jgi:hypothetical protein
LNKKYTRVTPIETEISGLQVIGMYSVNSNTFSAEGIKEFVEKQQRSFCERKVKYH